MHDTLQIFSENLLNMLRGALWMQFIVMAVNLYPRRKESPILSYLYWILIVVSILVFLSFGYMFEELRYSELFNDFKILTDLCFVPLVASLLLKILIPECINARKILLLLTPTIVLMVLFMITGYKLVSILSFVYAAILAAVIFIFIIGVSIRYDRFLKNHFSNIDNKTVGWVRTASCLFIIWYLTWSVVIKTDNRLIDSAYTLFIICIWVFIYRQSIKHVSSINAQELFEKQPVNTDEQSNSYINNRLNSLLSRYMNEERPWLNPSVTSQELADLMGTNRTYLSEYLNKQLNTNFYDYLNSFRVQEACDLLLSDPDKTLIQVSEQSGFNSLSTFRRAFEKSVGCSPATYRKNKAYLNS